MQNCIYTCIVCVFQVQCSGGTLPLSIPSTPPASEAPRPTPPTIASDDASSTGGASNSTHPAGCSGISYHEFVTALDLVPVHRARKIRQARRRNTECETIDLEEPQTPISPPTPRTPKLLISQLSRDASANGAGGSQGSTSRRRLSCLRQSLDKRPEKLPGEEKEGEADTESDGESTESSTDDPDEPKLHKKSLFSIDVSSALGQRVLKHMTAEIHVPCISDAEQFCRTPIKDKYQDRLRIRQLNYPITWKLTRKRLRQQTHCHLYKFTRGQKFEFMEKMRTGLNWQCRKLLSCLKRCSVVVKRLSAKTLSKWKPSLNKITVPLKPLTAEEIRYWTQPKAVSPQPSVFPDGPTFLLNDIDRVLGLKRKDGDPEVASKLLASHCVSETANAELQLQKLTVYRSLLTDLSSSVVTDKTRRSGTAVQRRPSSEKEKSYPTLFSILSGTSPSFKVPCKKKAGNSVSVDVKKPLKIDIPSPSAAHLPPLTRSDRSSPLDDSFSIMTVSSDEDNTRSAVCCSLCAVRNKCQCSPEKAASSVTSRCSHSPAVASKVSTPSLGSPIPPTLASPSHASKISASSQSALSLSPPRLSPISQGTESCPQSPASTKRLMTRSSTSAHSPKPSVTSLIRSSVSLPVSPLAHCPRSKSPSTQSTGRVSECFRNGSDMVVQDLRGAASQVSKDLLQPLLAVQRPSTRSSSRESTTSEAAAARNKTRKESPAGPSRFSTNMAPKTETDPVMSRVASRLTRSSTYTLEKCTGSAQDCLDQDVHCSSRQPRNGQGCRSSSNSSDRIQKAGGRKNNSGQNSRSNSNSSDRNQRRVTRRKASDGVSRTLRSSNPVGKLQPGHNSNVNGVHANSASNGPSIRRSSRGNLFANMGEGKTAENGVEPVQPRAAKRGATEATAAQSSCQDTSPSSVAAANPFLISKAQTQLFSSNVLEQARRHWNRSHKSPTRDGGVKGVLRSGNTFRMSHIALGSPAKSFSSGSSATQSVSSSGGSPRHKVKVDSTAGAHSPGLPSQRVPLSPTWKRLSPMQMLSVLESAKATSSASKVKSSPTSPAKSSMRQKRLDRAFTRITGQSLGYHTRAKESSSPSKKARFGFAD